MRGKDGLDFGGKCRELKEKQNQRARENPRTSARSNVEAGGERRSSSIRDAGLKRSCVVSRRNYAKN